MWLGLEMFKNVKQQFAHKSLLIDDDVHTNWGN